MFRRQKRRNSEVLQTCKIICISFMWGRMVWRWVLEPSERDCHVGCFTVQFGRIWPKFQGCLLAPSSGRFISVNLRALVAESHRRRGFLSRLNHCQLLKRDFCIRSYFARYMFLLPWNVPCFELFVCKIGCFHDD
jgi:hypothetical protein